MPMSRELRHHLGKTYESAIRLMSKDEQDKDEGLEILLILNQEPLPRILGVFVKTAIVLYISENAYRERKQLLEEADALLAKCAEGVAGEGAAAEILATATRQLADARENFEHDEERRLSGQFKPEPLHLHALFESRVPERAKPRAEPLEEEKEQEDPKFSKSKTRERKEQRKRAKQKQKEEAREQGVELMETSSKSSDSSIDFTVPNTAPAPEPELPELPSLPIHIKHESEPHQLPTPEPTSDIRGSSAEPVMAKRQKSEQQRHLEDIDE